MYTIYDGEKEFHFIFSDEDHQQHAAVLRSVTESFDNITICDAGCDIILIPCRRPVPLRQQSRLPDDYRMTGHTFSRKWYRGDRAT